MNNLLKKIVTILPAVATAVFGYFIARAEPVFADDISLFQKRPAIADTTKIDAQINSWYTMSQEQREKRTKEFCDYLWNEGMASQTKETQTLTEAIDYDNDGTLDYKVTTETDTYFYSVNPWSPSCPSNGLPKLSEKRIVSKEGEKQEFQGKVGVYNTQKQGKWEKFSVHEYLPEAERIISYKSDGLDMQGRQIWIPLSSVLCRKNLATKCIPESGIFPED